MDLGIDVFDHLLLLCLQFAVLLLVLARDVLALVVEGVVAVEEEIDQLLSCVFVIQ